MSIFRSLRGRVVIGVAGGSLLMILTLYATFLPRVRARFVSEREVEAVRAAEGIASEVATNVATALGTLSAIADLDGVRSMDPEQLDRVLPDIEATSPFFLHLSALTPDGVIVSRPSIPGRVGESRADRPYAQAIGAGAATFVGEPRMSGLDTISVNTSAAILGPDGSLAGTLMGALGAADRNRFLYEPVLMPTTPESWRVRLVSRTGFLLADSRLTVDSDGGLEGIDLREHPSQLAEWGEVVRYETAGEEIVAAIARVPEVDWRVVVEVEEAGLVATANAATRDLLFSTGLMALVMLGVGMLLTERLVRRVSTLTTALNRHATDLDVTLPTDERRDELGEAFAAFNHMVTEQRRLRGELSEKEQSLLQAGKMEAMGRLAGGVAHDFNNLLTVILGYAELIEDRAGPDGEDAARITQAAEQAQSLTRSLLAFSRKRPDVGGEVDLNEVAKSAQDLLEPLIEATIDLEVRFYPAPVPVRGDRHHLLQTVVNLAVNARDAMPDGGRLIIAVEARVQPGQTGIAVLRVEDDGEGIDPEVRDLVFEPFYTTKAPGEGTGLGLSMARTVVEQIGGWIELATEVGEGTKFNLCFPYTPESDEGESGPTGEGRSSNGAGLRVVLVEDQEAVRNLAAQLLRRAGHEVEAVGSAEAALEALAGHPEPDVLLTDIDLPGMDGLTLAKRVAETRPRIGIALMSGNVSPSPEALADIRPGTALLTKPFAGSDLLAVVIGTSKSHPRTRSA